MSFLTGTFRGKLLMLVAFTGTVTALLVASLVLNRHLARDRAEMLENLAGHAEALAIHSVAPLRFGDAVAANETLAALDPVAEVCAAALFDTSGAPFARYLRAGVRETPALDAALVGHRHQGTWLLMAEPVSHGASRLGTLVVAYDTSWVRRALAADTGFAALMAVLAVTVGLLLALPLQRSLSRPIRELVRVSRVVTSGGGFSIRATCFAQDELGDLTGVFNGMLARIEWYDEDIRRANERYDLVNRATNDVFWDWDLATGRLHWSEAAERSFGYTIEELGPTTDGWLERVHPEDRARVWSSLEGAIERGEGTWSAEYRLRRKDGSVGAYVDRGVIARDADGRPYRVVGSMMDLTERKEAEAAVQEAVARLRGVMNAVPALVWVAGVGGEATEFNDRWYAYTGWDLERSRGDGWLRALHPEDADAWLSRWREAREAAAPLEAEARLRGLDGSYRWFALRMTPARDVAGRLVAWYGTGADIQDRKGLESGRLAAAAGA